MNYSIFKVIGEDYCIGCGACTLAGPGFSIEKDNYGMFKARYKTGIPNTDLLFAEKVCPFSDIALNENQISDLFFSNIQQHDENLGKYIDNYVGYVKEEPFREEGSSGGFGKWILRELLAKDLVDFVVQVSKPNTDNDLFAYQIFSKDDDVLKGSKSAYYPITLVDALGFIRENEGRYAITALPCFSKALRNICLNDPIFNQRIKFIVGIVCGHLKSTAFAELFGWQLGVKPNSLMQIEFRGKIDGLPANEKGVFAIDKNGEKSKMQSSRSLVGGNWGHGLFKYKACDYCDDVLAETADVAIGDAWLDDFINDPCGNNILVVRNFKINELIEKGQLEGRLNFKPIQEKEVIKSQAGGLKNRREGLLVRVTRQKKKGKWTPLKRTFSLGGLSTGREQIYLRREDLRIASHKIFLKAKNGKGLSFFINKIQKKIRKLEEPTFRYRIENKLYLAWQPIKRTIKRFI